MSNIKLTSDTKKTEIKEALCILLTELGKGEASLDKQGFIDISEVEKRLGLTDD